VYQFLWLWPNYTRKISAFGRRRYRCDGCYEATKVTGNTGATGATGTTGTIGATGTIRAMGSKGMDRTM